MILNELSTMNLIIDKILSHKYPQDSSIVNDTLRVGLAKAYGINLNMLDTIMIPIKDKDGSITFFYVYTGPKETIDKIYSILDNNNINRNFILGRYPNGIFLGFFPVEFTDSEYCKNHILEYIIFIYYAAKEVSNYYQKCFNIDDNNLNAYGWYLDYFSDIYTAKSVIQLDENITIDKIEENLSSLSFYYDAEFTVFITTKDLFYYALNNKKEFMNAASLARNGEYYNFYAFYLKEKNSDEEI